MNEKTKTKRVVRRYSLEEKLRLLDEADKPGESIGTVARQAGVSPSVMFKWRQARESGALTGLKSEEELVPAVAVRDSEATATNDNNSTGAIKLRSRLGAPSISTIVRLRVKSVASALPAHSDA